VSKTRNFGTNDKTRPIALGGQQLSHVELFRTSGTIAEQTTKTLDTVQVICHNVVTVTEQHSKTNLHNLTSDINLEDHMKTLLKRKMHRLQQRFPAVWVKDGAEFDGSTANKIWTGEGSEIDGYAAFNYYAYQNTMGVHPELDEYLRKLGLYAEFYDAGTVFIYEN